MKDTAQQYTQSLLGYIEGKDPLSTQQGTPAKLAALIKGKKSARLTKRPAPGKWSVAEILAHYADGEIAISWRLRQILTSDGAAIQAYRQDSWAPTSNYPRPPPPESHENSPTLPAPTPPPLRPLP